MGKHELGCNYKVCPACIEEIYGPNVDSMAEELAALREGHAESNIMWAQQVGDLQAALDELLAGIEAAAQGEDAESIVHDLNILIAKHKPERSDP